MSWDDAMTERLRSLGCTEEVDGDVTLFSFDKTKLNQEDDLDKRILAELPPRPPLVLVYWPRKIHA